MNVDITFPARLQFFYCHKKLLIKGFIQLIKDQTALGGNQSTVCIAVFLISNVHNGLAFLVYIIQHPHKILLIIAVVPVTFCNQRIDLFQRSFYNVVHLSDGDQFLVHLLCLFFHKFTDKIPLCP